MNEMRELEDEKMNINNFLKDSNLGDNPEIIAAKIIANAQIVAAQLNKDSLDKLTVAIDNLAKK